MDLASAVVEHALGVGELYRQNMALKNGLEQPRGVTLRDKPQPTPPTRPAPAAEPIAAAIPIPDRSWIEKAAIAALLAASGSGVGLVGYLAGQLGSAASSSATPAETRPADPMPSPIVAEEPQTDQLLGYLQERGYHLPRKAGTK